MPDIRGTAVNCPSVQAGTAVSTATVTSCTSVTAAGSHRRRADPRDRTVTCTARNAAAPLFYAPAALVVLGCIALTQSGGFALPGAGDVLIVGAAVLRALHVTVISRISAQRRLDPAAVTLVQLGTVAALTAMPAGVLGQFSAVALMSGRDWALTAYLALVCTVFAFGVQMWAVRYSTPARMSLLLGTEPLWAVVLGLGLAGDPVTALGALGAALVLIGTNWGRIVDSATISDARRRPRDAEAAGPSSSCVDQQRCRIAAL